MFKLTSVAQKWNRTSSKEKMILHRHHHRRAQICIAMPVLLARPTGAYRLEKTPNLPPSVKEEKVVKWMQRESAADQITNFPNARYTQERLDAMMHKYDTKFVNRYNRGFMQSFYVEMSMG